MKDFFRVKIVAKRQVTLPALMLKVLKLQEGDELEFEVDNGVLRAVRPLKLVPIEYFPAEVLDKLQTRTKEMENGFDDGDVNVGSPSIPSMDAAYEIVV